MTVLSKIRKPNMLGCFTIAPQSCAAFGTCSSRIKALADAFARQMPLSVFQSVQIDAHKQGLKENSLEYCRLVLTALTKLPISKDLKITQGDLGNLGTDNTWKQKQLEVISTHALPGITEK